MQGYDGRRSVNEPIGHSTKEPLDQKRTKYSSKANISSSHQSNLEKEGIQRTNSRIRAPFMGSGGNLVNNFKKVRSDVNLEARNESPDAIKR
jgi:hypothetical protein